MTGPGDAPDERAAIERLVAVARESAGESAEYIWNDIDSLPKLVVASIVPRNPDACAIALIGQGWLTVQAGGSGARWELGYTEDDLRFAAEVIEAAIEGRITEVTAFARSQVTASFSDGELQQTTVYRGCGAFLVPLPGWRRWGRTRIFSPYLRVEDR